jgi:hypothetical protein
MDTVASTIMETIGVFREIPSFQTWLHDQPANKDDVILINNSFVFREDVKTNKSNLHVALKYKEMGELEPVPYIAKHSGFISDLKYVSAVNSNSVTLFDLNTEVGNQRKTLGNLVFILIGHVDNSIKIEVPLSYSRFDKLIWDSTLRKYVKIKNREIHVKDTCDEERVWSEIEMRLPEKATNTYKNELRTKIGIGLDRLQDKAVARLVLPSNSDVDKNCITCQILKVLKSQREEYKIALGSLNSNNGASTDKALNEILRIAYNFASDAITFLRLIVSICDLKPIILWGTIAEQYDLSVAFRKLPWFRSRNKPSLKNYISIVGDARNSAFHNIFPFQKSLEVELPGSALQQTTIRFFSEFERKKENELKYQDKELVDVLFEFTRARTRRVSSMFWEQNLVVMDKTITLFDAVGKFLWKLM